MRVSECAVLSWQLKPESVSSSDKWKWYRNTGHCLTHNGTHSFSLCIANCNKRMPLEFFGGKITHIFSVYSRNYHRQWMVMRTAYHMKMTKCVKYCGRFFVCLSPVRNLFHFEQTRLSNLFSLSFDSFRTNETGKDRFLTQKITVSVETNWNAVLILSKRNNWWNRIWLSICRIRINMLLFKFKISNIWYTDKGAIALLSPRSIQFPRCLCCIFHFNSVQSCHF